MGLFPVPRVSPANASALFFYASLYGELFFVTQFLQTARRPSLAAGLHMIGVERRRDDRRAAGRGVANGIACGGSRPPAHPCRPARCSGSR